MKFHGEIARLRRTRSPHSPAHAFRGSVVSPPPPRARGCLAVLKLPDELGVERLFAGTRFMSLVAEDGVDSMIATPGGLFLSRPAQGERRPGVLKTLVVDLESVSDPCGRCAERYYFVFSAAGTA